MRLASIITLALAVTSLSSCSDTDTLVYPECASVELQVAFDWQNAPNANPAGMTVLFYPVEKGQIWRFDIPGCKGGRVRVPTADYNIVAYNSDAYNILWHNPDSFSQLCAYTKTIGFDETLEQDIKAEPNNCWISTLTHFTVESECSTTANPHIQTVTLFPSPLCAVYEIYAHNVSNAQNIRRATASLSGLSPQVVIHPLLLSEQQCVLKSPMTGLNSSSLHSVFNTFGNSAKPQKENTLTINTLLLDDQQLSFSFNVTTQILTAPNPKHVIIEVDRLNIPTINPSDTVGKGGIDVDVDDWTTVRIDLR